MSAHLHEWIGLIVRWLHVTAGVAWVGASFYFVWLENNLERNKPDLRDGIAGNLWSVHGGGFYYVEKYKVAPEVIPPTLHWFKWEAYVTWLSGIGLMTLIYYWNPATYMVDPQVSAISPAFAVSIGVGSILASWVFYDLVSRTKLLDHPGLLLVVMFSALTLAAYLLFGVLSPRAAYIHIGAMIGTMMAGNVYFVIIPNQKRLVAAARHGVPPDAEQGLRAMKRSRHNNYFTLPVLFIMISSHFSSTYGHPHGWAVLAGISAMSIAVRHYFNVREKEPQQAWLLGAAALGMFMLALVTVPWARMRDPNEGRMPQVAFATVQQIVSTRCVSCHSEKPSDEVFTTPPNDVRFDIPEDIVRYAERIKVRSSDLKTMPFVNKTGMTDEERATLSLWFAQGAKGPGDP